MEIRPVCLVAFGDTSDPLTEDTDSETLRGQRERQSREKQTTRERGASCPIPPAAAASTAPRPCNAPQRSADRKNKPPFPSHPPIPTPSPRTYHTHRPHTHCTSGETRYRRVIMCRFFFLSFLFSARTQRGPKIRACAPGLGRFAWLVGRRGS